MNREDFVNQFKCGDRVRDRAWLPSNVFVEITAIGSERFLAFEKDGIREASYIMDSRWELYPEPKPKVRRWLWDIYIKDSWLLSQMYSTDKEMRERFPASEYQKRTDLWREDEE